MRRSTWRRASFRRFAVCTESQLCKSWSCQFGQFLSGMHDSQAWRLPTKRLETMKTYWFCILRKEANVVSHVRLVFQCFSHSCLSNSSGLQMQLGPLKKDCSMFTYWLHNFTTFHNGSLAASSSPPCSFQTLKS